MKALVPVLLVSTACAAGADEIHLVGGGRISGQVVERTAGRVVVETGPGRVTLQAARVLRIEAGTSPLAEFQERARRVEVGDAAGWVALGRWADAHDLGTQAQSAYERALSAEPGNAEANEALGRVRQGGLWLSREEAYRAQGLVPFDGAWVTPGEREALVRERESAADSARAARESEARVQEAEARARAAEAEARRAEAEAAISGEPPVAGGLPYWPYAYGGGTGPNRPHRERDCCGPEHKPHPTTPTTPRTPPVRDRGDTKETDRHADPLPLSPMPKH